MVSLRQARISAPTPRVDGKAPIRSKLKSQGNVQRDSPPLHKVTMNFAHVRRVLLNCGLGV